MTIYLYGVTVDPVICGEKRFLKRMYKSIFFSKEQNKRHLHFLMNRSDVNRIYSLE